MTTKIVGGTVRDPTGTVIENAEISFTLTTPLAFRIADDSSIAPEKSVKSAADGTYTVVLECNDTITPDGTLYKVHERYPRMVGSKDYYIQVLSTLPGGTNQVLDLIVPELSPVGVVNDFLTKDEADDLYAPLGMGGGGMTEVVVDDGVDSSIKMTVFDKAGSNPAAVAIVDSSGAQISSFGGGVQYDEGNTDASITGTAMLWEDLADTLRAVSAAKPLPINLVLPSLVPVSDGGASLTVDGTVGISGTVPVSGPLTDAQLRATPVPVSGTVSTGGLTDTQLRATPVPISDGAGSVTVDAPVGTPVNVQVSDGTRTAAVRDTGATDSLNVAITDAAGGHITSFGGGTQYTEDAVSAADPVGTVPILVRKDTPSATVTTDGDNVAQRGTNFGAAYVTLLDTGGSPVSVGGGTQYTEDATSAADPIGTVPILVRKDTPAATVTTDGDNIAQRGSNFGGGYVHVLDSSGAIVSAFSGSGTQYTEDVAAVADPIGNMQIARRRDTLVSEVTTDGDNIALNSTSKGEQYVKHVDTIGVTGPLTDTQLRASAVPVSGPLTDAQLRASAVPVSGTVTVQDGGGSISIDDNAGSITVDGTVGVSGSVAVTGPLTDAQLRATPVPITGAYTEDAVVPADPTAPALLLRRKDSVSGEAANGDWVTAASNANGSIWASIDTNAGPVSVTGPLTDTQLRASAVPVSLASVPSHAVDTELPAAATLADATANPSTTLVEALLGVFNGTTWDRVRGDITNGLDVDVTRLPALPAGTNNIGDVDVLTLPAISLAGSSNNIGDVDVLTLPSLPAGTNNIGDVDVLTLPSLPAGSNNIGDVDVLSVIPGTGATNLGKAEDAPHTTADVGVMALGVRNDAGTAFAADGDYVPLSVDAAGAVRVTGGGGGTQYTEDAVAAADPVGTAVILTRRDTPSSIVSANGDNISQQGTQYGAAYTQILTSAGAFVDTFGGGVQYVEDAVSAADPTGTATILVRKDTPAATVTTDGDNIAQRGSNFGAAYSHLLDASGNIISTFGGGTQYTEDAAAAADPVGGAMILVRRDTLSATEVSADGDNIAAKGNRVGAQYTKGWDEEELGPFTPTIDTAVYANLDRLGAVVTLTGAGLYNGASGIIVGSRLIDYANSLFTIDIHWFKVTPTLVGADNAALDITDANLATAIYIGTINYNSANTKTFGTNNRVTQGTYLGGVPALRYKCASGDSAIYGIMEARGAYDAAATTDINLWFSVVRYY